MKKITAILFLSGLVMLFPGCGEKPLPTGDQLEVSWKVISNVYADQPGVKAMFTLVNHSALTLDASNWALYFNQTPRGIRSVEGHAQITRLSGDWYRLSPAEGFRLEPGGKTEIVYEASDWLIKESDAPMGPYFVFYGKKGEEKSVVAATHYTIEPFTLPEQIDRHRNDSEPIPTPEVIYQRNLQLTDLPAESLPALVPTPVSIRFTGKTAQFSDVPAVVYQKGLEQEAALLAAVVGKLAGGAIQPREGDQPTAHAIFLGLEPMTVNGISEEAYKLEIREDPAVVITGSDPAGVFYGMMTLMGLAPANAGNQGGLPVVTVEDAPRFSFRSLHIDVARNFQSKETLRKMIDIMAYYKLNTLQLYLSEDEGWRLAIEELPELTEVASRRGHTTKDGIDMLHPSYGSGPFADAEGSTGSGFYTREEFKEILRYAHQRHVRIIPTINFPGHSRAAIRAMEARYQKFMKEGNAEKAEEFRLIDPDDQSVYNSAQNYDDNVVCVARESVYKFYETVIDDIMEMYAEAEVPLEIFHTGGDEVPEGVWTKSPLCAKLMEGMPEIGDPKNLQSYFLKRAMEILEARNLQAGGWEEVALLKNEEGKYVPNPAFAGKGVIPWAWNNLGQWANLSYRLANAGYPVVMCDVSNFYFDFAYSKDPREPGLYWGGFCDVRNAWQFAPYNSFVTNLKTSMGRDIDPEKEYAGLERLKPEARKNIVGLQAQLWAETILGPKMLENRALPKLIGFAETAWGKARPWESEANPVRRKQLMDEGWNHFANRLGKRELPRLSGLFGGFDYRIPPPGAVIEEGILKANTEYPGLKIRYTTDGSEPTGQSPIYGEPVEVNGEVQLKAFDAAGKSSRVVRVAPK